MTMNRRSLNRWAKSRFRVLTKEQKRIILERFGAEPEPYEWSEQDIGVQLRNYLSCGEFVEMSHDSSPLEPSVDF